MRIAICDPQASQNVIRTFVGVFDFRSLTLVEAVNINIYDSNLDSREHQGTQMRSWKASAVFFNEEITRKILSVSRKGDSYGTPPNYPLNYHLIYGILRDITGKKKNYVGEGIKLHRYPLCTSPLIYGHREVGDAC